VIEHGSGEFVWFPEKGYGYIDADPTGVYGDSYIEKYRAYEETEVGRRINEARVKLVKKYTGVLRLVDVGVGSGAFMREIGCLGYDVNPAAVEKMKEAETWCDPTVDSVNAATFWDSMEHMENPRDILDNVEKWAFLSIPVFSGPSHVLRSKHLRRDEHYWYFTERGLGNYMRDAGFFLVERSRMEERYGREDIGTFVFLRN